MTKPLLVLTAVFALGLAYVVFPVMMQAYMSYRKNRQVRCPEEQENAIIKIDAKTAAFGAAQGKVLLQVRNCTLWPQKRGCDQRCLAAML